MPFVQPTDLKSNSSRGMSLAKGISGVADGSLRTSAWFYHNNAGRQIASSSALRKPLFEPFDPRGLIFDGPPTKQALRGQLWELNASGEGRSICRLRLRCPSP